MKMTPTLSRLLRASWEFVWPYQSVKGRHLLMILPAAAGLALYAVWLWLTGPDDETFAHVIELTPVPVAFLLLVMLFEQDRPVKTARPLALIPAALAWLLALATGWQVLLAVAVVCACFTFIDPRDFLARCARAPRPAAIALVAALCAKAYSVFQDLIWQYMSVATAWTIYQFLQLFGVDVEFTVRLKQDAIRLHSTYYNLNVYKPCSGLEGIFLFTFLFSCAMLIDWKWFSRLKRNDLYIVGAVYMFCFNALRILALYLMGNWSAQPDASELAISMRGWPLEMFHSTVGWVLYLFAFGVFITIFYRLMGRTESEG